MKKSILCFGDSNTWGLNPATGKRFEEKVRWPSVLAERLGDQFAIIEAGQPNRTLVNNPPFNGDLSGVSYLKPLLEAHSLTAIVIALGTNDLKKRFKLTPEQIGNGLANLIGGIEGFYEGYKQPKLIILSPPYVSCVGQYKHVYEGAPSKNEALKKEFENIARAKKAYFCDLQQSITVSPIDGVHIEANSHAKIAGLVCNLINEVDA
ncbi:SGNH/GDSL hydrolase family protein [Pseudoalteromonas marina]|uniref:SGNH/GDSL hydrolase family protein n=1 Tax=Pseudoalteromonas marina TaxID=267375 RepID=UPI0023EF6E0C|nr:SGNH/GDSL hydrolase family protein [Pseudoalteromonas marina]